MILLLFNYTFKYFLFILKNDLNLNFLRIKEIRERKRDA